MNERTFVIETPQQCSRLLQFIAGRPIPFQCEVGPVREQRTVSQNSRLWALHALAAKESGHTADELHEFMLCKHFGYIEKEFAGVVRKVPLKRSSTRDKQEFREFLDAVESFYATTLGVWLGQEAA